MLLSDAIEAYNRDRKAKGMSLNTVRNQGVALRQFLAAVGNIQVNYIGPVQVDRFWAKHPDWGPGTYNLKRQVLMSFFEWLRQRGHMNKGNDPLTGLRKRRVPQQDWNLIPPSDFERVIDCAPNARDRAMVATSLYLFTRVSETKELRWRDIDFDNYTIQVYRTKVGEYDQLPMCAELEVELRRWRFEYGSLVGQVPRPEWYVFPAYSKPLFSGRGGNGLYLVKAPELMPTTGLSGITTQIKAVLEVAGYDDDQEGGHTLRRSGATALYHELSSQGHDRAMRTVQAMLGHKNLATTEIYLSLNLDRKARNDLLAGRRMFAEATTAEVVAMDLEALDGEEDVGGLRV